MLVAVLPAPQDLMSLEFELFDSINAKMRIPLEVWPPLTAPHSPARS